MLNDNEVALVEWVKEVEQQEKKEADLQAQLKITNELLVQSDRELEAKQQRANNVVSEKIKLEEQLQVKIEGLEDVGYAMFKSGFNESIAKVKHFNSGALINFSKVNRERRLQEMLVEGASVNQEAPMEEDESESTTCFPDHS